MPLEGTIVLMFCVTAAILGSMQAALHRGQRSILDELQRLRAAIPGMIEKESANLYSVLGAMADEKHAKLFRAIEASAREGGG